MELSRQNHLRANAAHVKAEVEEKQPALLQDKDSLQQQVKERHILMSYALL